MRFSPTGGGAGNVEDRPSASPIRNFAVSGASQEIAERIGRQAEKYRKDLAKVWLGKELGDWGKPCPISVALNDDRPNGLTTFDFRLPQDSWAPIGIRLSGRLDFILKNSLAHEITHAILADHFRRPMPRWADEGTAILSEGTDLHRRFEQITHDLDRRGRLCRLEDLFSMQAYPQQIEVLYAQGFSVTKFLVGQKDRKTLLAFLQAGMDDTWATAAQQHYGFESIEQMQNAWLDSIRQPQK